MGQTVREPSEEERVKIRNKKVELEQYVLRELIVNEEEGVYYCVEEQEVTNEGVFFELEWGVKTSAFTNTQRTVLFFEWEEL